jgi:nucleoside-diphosphate-sugar epimerase
MSSTQEAWLVTGGSGCIGAWTVLTLVREGVNVVALDRETGGHRQRLIASEDELARITAVQGDITDLAGLERVLAARCPSRSRRSFPSRGSTCP